MSTAVDAPTMLPHSADNCPLNHTILTMETGMPRTEISRAFKWLTWGIGLLCIIGLPCVGAAVTLSVTSQLTASQAKADVGSHLLVAEQASKHLREKLDSLADQQREWRDEQRRDMRELNKKVDDLKNSR